MARIGIYGGSFNPVHFGHVGLAKWVIEHTDLDEVWMMVSPNNPLKDSHILADEQERLEGVRQAIQGIKGLIASDFEFHLPRPSYTANTLRELQKTYPEHRFCLVIGEDNWDIFDRWREWEYILVHYPIYVYPRHQDRSCTAQAGQVDVSIRNRSETDQKPIRNRLKQGANRGQIQGAAQEEHNKAEVHYLEEAPYFDISSTQIREMKKE